MKNKVMILAAAITLVACGGNQQKKAVSEKVKADAVKVDMHVDLHGIRFDLFRYRLFLLVAPAGDKRYRSREDHDFILHSRFV